MQRELQLKVSSRKRDLMIPGCSFVFKSNSLRMIAYPQAKTTTAD